MKRLNKYMHEKTDLTLEDYQLMVSIKNGFEDYLSEMFKCPFLASSARTTDDEGDVVFMIQGIYMDKNYFMQVKVTESNFLFVRHNLVVTSSLPNLLHKIKRDFSLDGLETARES